MVPLATIVERVTEQAQAESSGEPDLAASLPGNQKKPSKKRLIITTVIGTIIMIGIFTVIFPKLGDYGQALEQLKDLPVGWVIALVLAGALNIFAYPFTVLVSVPGLKYWPGFIERQVGFLISCAIGL